MLLLGFSLRVSSSWIWRFVLNSSCIWFSFRPFWGRRLLVRVVLVEARRRSPVVPLSRGVVHHGRWWTDAGGRTAEKLVLVWHRGHWHCMELLHGVLSVLRGKEKHGDICWRLSLGSRRGHLRQALLRGHGRERNTLGCMHGREGIRHGCRE